MQMNGEKKEESEDRREGQLRMIENHGSIFMEKASPRTGPPNCPIFEQRFEYEPKTPWPHRVSFHERIPGTSSLTETRSSRFNRDALGRVVEERRNDGSKVERSTTA
jgi:YD repeat-containing protein